MRNRQLLSRRRLLSGTATAIAAGAAVPVAEATANSNRSAAARARFRGAPGSSGVTLRWLGNNAWQITFGATTVLIDPWVTRFPTGTYAGGSRPDTPLTTDRKIVDRYIDRADLILVCHGHFDHMADVPYIATRTGAAVLGTETHANLLARMGTPTDQIGVVRGGEHIQYGGFTVEVIPSLHSLTGDATSKVKQVPFSGTRTGAPRRIPRPRTIADLVEGGTLAYQITVADAFRIMVLSTANFIERELSGLQPDLAIVPAGGRSIHDYAGRLMRALDFPTWVAPTHWDDFDLPLDRPAKDVFGIPALRNAVAAASPGTTFVAFEHLQSFTP